MSITMKSFEDCGFGTKEKCENRALYCDDMIRLVSREVFSDNKYTKIKAARGAKYSLLAILIWLLLRIIDRAYPYNSMRGRRAGFLLRCFAILRSFLAARLRAATTWSIFACLRCSASDKCDLSNTSAMLLVCLCVRTL